MALLNYEVLKKSGYDGYVLENAPEKVMQFGEGNFLRAFVDYFFDVANEKADWNGKVVLVQPIAMGLTELINEQQGLYTLYLRGSEKGVKVFKFFPAESFGGLKTIKALCGPFPQIRIIPTGGINQANVADYFKNPKIVAVGGSWMCTKDMISAGDFDAITEKSRAATDLFKEIRG